MLGPEHKIEKCKSLVNIDQCGSYVQGSFSGTSDGAFFRPALQTFARIGLAREGALSSAHTVQVLTNKSSAVFMFIILLYEPEPPFMHVTDCC